MIHVAILKPGYLNEILAGRKTIESRLTKTAQPPFEKIETGERLFLKASAGPFMATAIAGKVLCIGNLQPRDIDQLHKRYGRLIGGDDDYWQSKRDSRYATLIELRDVEPIDVGPNYSPAHMKAWYVLDDRHSPLRDWEITAGALRNRYAMLPLPGESARLTGSAITLELPDGEVVSTDLVKGRMLRWRGWGPTYESANAKAGDVLRYLALGSGRYAVRVVKR